MKTTIAPAVERADTTQEASGPSAAEVTHERASATLRDLDAQIRAQRQTADGLAAELQILADAEAAEHAEQLRVAAEVHRASSARDDARMRAGLVQGTDAQPAADARVAQLDAELDAATERATDLQTAIFAQATAREARQRDLQSQHDEVQTRIAELQTQRTHLAQIAREAHQQIGEERAAAVEAELQDAQAEVERLEHALAVQRWRLIELQDSIIERLKEFKAHAERLDTTYGRAPDLPPGARVVALRAYTAFLGTLADVSDFYDEAIRLRFHQVLSLRPDVIGDILNTTDPEERARKVTMFQQSANIVLSGYEADHQEQVERYRANRRARRLAGGR